MVQLKVSSRQTKVRQAIIFYSTKRTIYELNGLCIKRRGKLVHICAFARLFVYTVVWMERMYAVFTGVGDFYLLLSQPAVPI